MSSYPHTYNQRRSLLTPDADPHDVLCRYFNVSRPVLPPNLPHNADLPPTIEVNIAYSGTHLPTHVLAVSPSNPLPDDGFSEPVAPILLPIDIVLYTSRLRADLILPEPIAATMTSGQSLNLPIVPLAVPHPPTLALLLLFALVLEPDPHTNLAYRLLPPTVIEEFPNSAAMASVLAQVGSSKEGFTRLLERNEGLWKNVLALGVREKKVVELIHMVWGVTAEARRARVRAAAAAAWA